MLLPKSVFLYGFLIALLLEPIVARKGFSGGHSYPKSGGLSGGGGRHGGLSGGGHGYPSSGGNHGYPSGGLSGGSHSSQSHAYPSGGSQSHGYPSGGSQSHSYPSGGSQPHGYPSGGSQSHAYPAGGSGLSGNGHGYPNNKPAGNYPSHHTTNVYNNYHYSPPQQISYASPHGGPARTYPVYQGTPPTYVYQYKDSGSKYGTLLAGLALLNLGTLAGAAYAHSSHSSSSSSQQYKPQPGEVCKFAVKKDNGDYEETRIDCKIISSFILQDQQAHTSSTNSTVTTTTTVTNVTVVNATNNMMPEQNTSTSVPNVQYTMLPNGTLVPVNKTGLPDVPGLPGSPVNTTLNETAVVPPSSPVNSTVTVTTTTTNVTLVNALDVKGKPVEVTPGMQCFVIRISQISNMKKTVPCGLLQTYAEKSIQKKNSAVKHGPLFSTIVGIILAYCVAY